jgi:hypothetical protein
MLNRARAGATEVTAHGTGEQLRGPFLAFGGRHRDLAGARLGDGWTNQGECSGLRMAGSGVPTRHLAGDVSVSRTEHDVVRANLLTLIRLSTNNAQFSHSRDSPR